MDENNRPRCDMTVTHYKPIGKAPVCGVFQRVGDDELTSVPTSSDIYKTNCLLCRAEISRLASVWMSGAVKTKD